MKSLTNRQDAYGQAIYDYHRGNDAYEVNERDDGYIGIARPADYFRGHEEWPRYERQAIRLARGKVLDVGCGAGRHSLYLREKGLDVLPIDLSPLAIVVCQLRGLKNARVMSITEVSGRLGTFDTILMLGNNFGLFGSFDQARLLLDRFHGMTSRRARIIAETNDPYETRERCHLDYHERNRKRGRMGGQVKMRVRYKKFATPWFDYLLVSRGEMQDILDGTGWRVSRFIDSGWSAYIAVMEKKG